MAETPRSRREKTSSSRLHPRPFLMAATTMATYQFVTTVENRHGWGGSDTYGVATRDRTMQLDEYVYEAITVGRRVESIKIMVKASSWNSFRNISFAPFFPYLPSSLVIARLPGAYLFLGSNKGKIPSSKFFFSGNYSDETNHGMSHVLLDALHAIKSYMDSLVTTYNQVNS
ncbi:hypothetical protein Lal_00028212 [Lupinus albus]|nr:hypothetical protein Lal_00028212 [Lupinus albus]